MLRRPGGDFAARSQVTKAVASGWAAADSDGFADPPDPALCLVRRSSASLTHVRSMMHFTAAEWVGNTECAVVVLAVPDTN